MTDYYNRDKILIVISKRFFQLSQLASILVSSTLMIGCQEEEKNKNKMQDASAADTLLQPSDYLLRREVSGNGKIYCAASMGREQSLALIAFKFADHEVSEFKKSHSGTGVQLRNSECDLSRLTNAGLKDFLKARKEAHLQNSVGVFLHFKINGKPKKTNVSISQFETDVHEDLQFELDSLIQFCAIANGKVDGNGFQKFVKKRNCGDVKVHYTLQSPYTYSGVALDEHPPAIISCTKPAGVFPNGACFLKTWFRQRSVGLTFPAKDLSSWREFRGTVFNLLESRLIVLHDRYGCVGIFCKKIERRN